MPTLTAIVPVSRIDLDRAEGPAALCGAFVARSWLEADAKLTRWARTAPEHGKGYDKVDFTVTWADGETYQGRYDMNREGCDGVKGHDLAQRIRHYLAFLAHRPKCQGHKADADTRARAIDAQGFLNDYLGAGSIPSAFWCCAKGGR